MRLKWSSVPFEWALRDALQGRRLIGVAFAVALPALFLLTIVLIEGKIESQFTDEITSLFLTTLLMPPLAAILALILGGTVLRAPLEDGTLIYMLTRPVHRLGIGVSRALAIALLVGLGTMVSGFTVAMLLGKVGMAFGALPGLFVGGFALGAIYGFILSIHRYALGAVLVHAVVEASISRIPFAGITQWTVTWHAWGGMGRAATVGAEIGFLPNTGGNLFVPILMALFALAASGVLWYKRGFNLGVAEA